MPIAHEGQGALAEIPQDRTEGFQPLDSQNHVEGAKGEAIAIYGECLILDPDHEPVIATWTVDVIAIGNRDVDSWVTLKWNADSCRRLRVHEIVGRAGVQECKENNVVDADAELHCVPGSWLDTG
jgi:hypothetical protein